MKIQVLFMNKKRHEWYVYFYSRQSSSNYWIIGNLISACWTKTRWQMYLQYSSFRKRYGLKIAPKISTFSHFHIESTVIPKFFRHFQRLLTYMDTIRLTCSCFRIELSQFLTKECIHSTQQSLALFSLT